VSSKLKDYIGTPPANKSNAEAKAAPTPQNNTPGAWVIEYCLQPLSFLFLSFFFFFFLSETPWLVC
jgi:hypothetical protein